MKKMGAAVLAAVLVTMSFAGCSAPVEENANNAVPEIQQKQLEKISHFTNTRTNDVVITYDDGGMQEWNKMACEQGCCVLDLKHNSGNGEIYTDVYDLQGKVNSAEEFAKLMIPAIKEDYDAKEVSEPQNLKWGLHEGQMVDVVTINDENISIYYTFENGYGVAASVKAWGENKEELVKQFKDRFLDNNFRIYIR